MLKTFKWCVNANAQQNTELAVNTVSFGDGYEQVSSYGINNARKTWQCSKTGYKDEVDAVYDFLIEHKGVTPFLIEQSDMKGTYRTIGDISKNHDSGKVWTISFSLKQVFLP